MLEITNSVGTYSNQLCIAMGEELVCTLCIPSTLCTALNLPYLFYLSLSYLLLAHPHPYSSTSLMKIEGCFKHVFEQMPSHAQMTVSAVYVV